MTQIEQYQRNRQHDFLQAVAVCLVVAVVLVMVGAVFRSSVDIPGLSTRNTLTGRAASHGLYSSVYF